MSSSNMIQPASGASSSTSTSEIEETLARISSHRGVEGVIIMNKEGATIQSTLREDQTTAHAALLSQITSRAMTLVETLDAGDELTFLRIKSKNREIMISPDKEFLLVVIQNPNVAE